MAVADEADMDADAGGGTATGTKGVSKISDGGGLGPVRETPASFHDDDYDMIVPGPRLGDEPALGRPSMVGDYRKKATDPLTVFSDGGESDAFDQLKSYDLDSAPPPTGDNGGDVAGGAKLASSGKAAWESAWADLDEERDFPDSRRYEADPYGLYAEGDKKSGSQAGGRSSSDLFPRFRYCWSETRRRATQRGFVIIFVLMAALIAVFVVLDTVDALGEWSSWSGGNTNDEATETEAVIGKQEATHLEPETLTSLAQGTEGGTNPPPPPSNLDDICASASTEEECKEKCSEAECCFAPWWHQKSCKSAEQCVFYVKTCEILLNVSDREENTWANR